MIHSGALETKNEDGNEDGDDSDGSADTARGGDPVCGGRYWPRCAQAADNGKPARLLVVTVTTGFRHASINTAEPVLEQLGRERGLYHLDYLRMPEGRPSQPKSPKRAEGVSDADWQQQETAFKAAEEQFRRRRGLAAGPQRAVREGVCAGVAGPVRRCHLREHDG